MILVALCAAALAPLAAARSAEPRFDQCPHWLSNGFAAFACSPTQLKAAFEQDRMTDPGAFNVLVAGRSSQSTPGMVQVLGGPARPGAVFRLVGHPARDEFVGVNVYTATGGLIRVTLTHVVMKGPATLRVVGAKAQLHGARARLQTTVLIHR